MNFSVWERLQPLSESFRDPSGLHKTNPFANDVEPRSSLNTGAEDLTVVIIATSYRANPEDNAEGARPTNTWPPLKAGQTLTIG